MGEQGTFGSVEFTRNVIHQVADHLISLIRFIGLLEMKIQFYCMKCTNEIASSNDPLADNISFTEDCSFTNPVEHNNSGIYEVSCNNGHLYQVLLNNYEYEMIFDLGVLALFDDYPRESVSTIATALERFYEFVIRVLLVKNNVSITKVKDLWKQIGRLSERQYGAFLSLWILEYKESIVNLDSIKIKANGKSTGLVTFRNQIIHKGYIPSSQEAKDYLSKIMTHINTLDKQLHETNMESCHEYLEIYLLEKEREESTKCTSQAHFPSFISVSKRCDGDVDKVLEEWSPICRTMYGKERVL